MTLKRWLNNFSQCFKYTHQLSVDSDQHLFLQDLSSYLYTNVGRSYDVVRYLLTVNDLLNNEILYDHEPEQDRKERRKKTCFGPALKNR